MNTAPQPYSLIPALNQPDGLSQVLFKNDTSEHTLSDLLEHSLQIYHVIPVASTSMNEAVVLCDNIYELTSAMLASLARGYQIFLITAQRAKSYLEGHHTLVLQDIEPDGLYQNNPNLCLISTIQPQTEPTQNIHEEDLEHFIKIIKDLNFDDCFISQMTSGSTGTPKVITRSLTSLSQEITQVLPLIKAKLNGQIPLVTATVPCYHSFGLVFHLLSALVGGFVIYENRLTYQEELYKRSLNDTPKILVTSPSFLKRMSKKHSQVPQLLAISAGGMLPYEVWQKGEIILNCPFLEIFGSSETGVIAYRIKKTQDDLWNVLEDTQVQAYSTNGQDAQGQLIVTSEHCDITNTTVRLEADSDPVAVFCSDDMIEMVGSSQFRHIGRMGRLVKIEDNRFSLDEIENNLRKSSLVEDVAVIRSSNDQREYTSAMVVLSEKGLQLQKQLSPGKFAIYMRVEFCRLEHSLAVPRRLIFTAILPSTPTGKIDYRRITFEFDHEIS